ncbi:hypothetical protein A3219_20620 [Salmonella enterica]|nr:hypothetical protein A3219_20620 [Salmonella enterica]
MTDTIKIYHNPRCSKSATRLDQAISLLSSASAQAKLGSQQQARYDARIDQLRQLQERFKPYTKM